MARPLRIEFPDAWYHVMNRGNNRQPIFESAHDYLAFLKLLKECFSLWTLECHAYCMMPNHYHLLVSTPLGNLSRAMRHLDGVYTQRFNKHHNRDGHLFRGRYKAILVDVDSYLLQVARYIHLNPVKAKLARLPESYSWSSYRFYLNSRGKPDALITHKIVELFGSTEKAIPSLRQFTEAGIDEPIDRFYRSTKQSPILGSSQFIQEVKDQWLGNKSKMKEIPKRERMVHPPSASSIIKIVADAYEVAPSSITSPLRGRFNEQRRIAMYLARYLTAAPLVQIGKDFGGVGYSTVSMACKAIEKRKKENQVWAKRLQDLEDVINKRETDKDALVI